MVCQQVVKVKVAEASLAQMDEIKICVEVVRIRVNLVETVEILEKDIETSVELTDGKRITRVEILTDPEIKALEITDEVDHLAGGARVHHHQETDGGLDLLLIGNVHRLVNVAHEPLINEEVLEQTLSLFSPHHLVC